MIYSQRVDGVTSDQSESEPDDDFMDWSTLQQVVKVASSSPGPGPSSSSRVTEKSVRTVERGIDGQVSEQVDEQADEVDELEGRVFQGAVYKN